MDKIGLVIAMPIETENILHTLGELKTKEVISGYEISNYSVYDKEIYLADCGVGVINAAAATMLLIEKYGVEVIINFGIAGSLKDKIRIGDLLIAKDIVHYDYDASAFLDIKKGQYLGAESVELPCNEEMIELADVANGSPMTKVRIASADKFISSSKIKQELINEFDTDICEMESIGILRVSDRAGIPSLFIKTISDNADEQAEDSIINEVGKGITVYGELIEKLISIL